MNAYIINDNGTDRAMTEEEAKQYEIYDAQRAKDDAKLQMQIDAHLDARESARNKLKALGLTDAEIAALVG